MLYFLYGTDIPKVVDKARALVAAMLTKKPNASLFKLTSDNWDVAQLQELLVSQALFENKYIVEISRVMETAAMRDEALEYLAEMQSSENIFIWVEGEVDKKTLAKIEKHAEKVQEFVAKEVAKKIEFNIFALGDAMGARDRKKLWMLYNDAKNFFAVEEIHGTLFWQAKSMALAVRAKSAEDAGLKPFVYSKSARMAKNFSPEELSDLTSRLIAISHDARRGMHDFDIALERFCLEV